MCRARQLLSQKTWVGIRCEKDISFANLPSEKVGHVAYKRAKVNNANQSWHLSVRCRFEDTSASYEATG